MKVLLVITHGNIGGATNVVIDLARGLKAAGVQVAVGFSEGAYLEKKLAESAIPRFKLKNIERSHNPVAALSFIFEIKRLVRKEGFDVVQFNSSNSLPGCLGAKLGGKKIRTVFTIHGLSVLDKNCKTFFLLKFAYGLVFKFFLSFTDAAVFVSKNNLEEAERIGLVKNGVVIYNGLSAQDLVFLPKDEARGAIEKKAGTNLAGKFLIGSIGRLSYQKNYEFLIRSFPELLKVKNDVACVVIGDGPTRTACERLIDELHLNDKMFLAGEIDDASRYLRAFDLFILPSRYEGLPVTLVECRFAGVPALASHVGGNDEIVEENGLYDLDDKADLIRKFAAFMQGGARNDHGDWKEKFSAEHMSREYLELFRRLQ